MRSVVLAGAAAAVLAWGASFAQAPTASWPDALSARMHEIKSSGTVRVGYRERAVPFSYVAPDGRPIGYSIDICAAIVATLADDIGRELAIRYVAVTPEDRIAKVVSGAVDLECGATTITAERRKSVDFSPVIFVTGVRFATPRAGPVRDPDDLRGRRIAVVAGTTAEATVREYDRLQGYGLSIVHAGGYPEAIVLASAGKADAVAADDVLLRAALLESGRTSAFVFIGDVLAPEPYGIAYPRDEPMLAEAVRRTLSLLAETREIAWIYDRWFVHPLPSGARMSLPMPQPLRRAFELIGLPPD